MKVSLAQPSNMPRDAEAPHSDHPAPSVGRGRRHRMIRVLAAATLAASLVACATPTGTPQPTDPNWAANWGA